MPVGLGWQAQARRLLEMATALMQVREMGWTGGALGQVWLALASLPSPAMARVHWERWRGRCWKEGLEKGLEIPAVLSRRCSAGCPQGPAGRG